MFETTAEHQLALSNGGDTKLELSVFLLDSNSQLAADSFYEEIIGFVESLSNGYIWNNDKFSLTKPFLASNPKNDSENIFQCTGEIDFGDNIEDEWFVVYLLIELTRKFSKKIAAKISDIDGDFMLIHAANQLPEWAACSADLESMQNRVFIFDGQLCMIPPASSPAQVTYLPADGPITDAVGAVKTLVRFKDVCVASQPMQDSIRTRIAHFQPDLITKTLFHRATCVIPAKLAMLLKSNPSLISSAINRFCDKDPQDLKLCRTFETFPPSEFIKYRVVFTKHLYGKLKYCRYKTPDTSAGWPALDDLLPSLTLQMDTSTTVHHDKQLVQERYNLGFKLTCAFEMLSKLIVTETKANASFDNYIDRLTSLGYFKDFIQHSKNYNDLLEKARSSFYTNGAGNQPQSPRNASTSSPMKSSTNPISNKQFEDIYKIEMIDLSELKAELIKSIDDSDDWLCVEAPQLDDYLTMYSKGECSSAYDFRVITSALQNFIKKMPSAKLTSTTQPDTGLGEVLTGGANVSAQHVVDFKPIDPDEKLVDIDIGLVEGNLNDLLSVKRDAGEENDEEGSDNESFYEIDDEMLMNASGGGSVGGGEGEKASSSTSKKHHQQLLKNYMTEMDESLKSERNLNRQVDINAATEGGDELDIDLNLVSNAIESYSSQLGLTGPVSNILKSLGL